MSPEEREQWRKLLHSNVSADRDGTIESILDLVEQLERDLATYQTQRTIDRQRIEMDDLELDRLRRELAATRSAYAGMATAIGLSLRDRSSSHESPVAP